MKTDKQIAFIDAMSAAFGGDSHIPDSAWGAAIRGQVIGSGPHLAAFADDKGPRDYQREIENGIQWVSEHLAGRWEMGRDELERCMSKITLGARVGAT